MVTRTSDSAVELHVRSGRAVIVDAPEGSEIAPERLRLPATLVEALHEWAGVADRVARGERAEEPVRDMVSRRGRQLAGRLAAETRSGVDYRDPVSGRVQRITGRSRSGASARSLSTAGLSASAHRTAEQDGAPVPWASGLTVSAVIAAVVAIVLVVVSSGLAEVTPLLAVVVNLAVAGGFAPSIWLGRAVATWRWVALGTASGLALAWTVLLLSLLG